MSEARIELAIFGFVDRRNIHYATRPCCIHGKFSSLAAQCSALPILNSEIRVQKKILKESVRPQIFSFLFALSLKVL